MIKVSIFCLTRQCWCLSHTSVKNQCDRCQQGLPSSGYTFSMDPLIKWWHYNIHMKWLMLLMKFWLLEVLMCYFNSINFLRLYKHTSYQSPCRKFHMPIGLQGEICGRSLWCLVCNFGDFFWLYLSYMWIVTVLMGFSCVKKPWANFLCLLFVLWFFRQIPCRGCNNIAGQTWCFDSTYTTSGNTKFSITTLTLTQHTIVIRHYKLWSLTTLHMHHWALETKWWIMHWTNRTWKLAFSYRKQDISHTSKPLDHTIKTTESTAQVSRSQT